MLTYRMLLLVKFVGVTLYAGGLIGGFVATALVERKRAVHAIASPGLVVTWLTGYLLTTQLHLPLTELWILGGLLLSLVSQLALVYSVSRDRRTVSAFLATFVPFFLVLVLMVFRPTWPGVHP
ncbi:hypothetical protein F0U60_16220 [Archangium minus]|uniref:Uncharacterized protein n=1 Tax=Archangium minus TaxID=83450 RepID=A0ABY9WUI8_9BACT|nr:hypothetical protein F0U61_16070 [Archangium violaceum]WNG45472.1 hypothetical protein F0U60_16220 [Archangium minus]